MPSHVAQLQPVNGVAFYTQKGRLKSRYRIAERLRFMGATSRDLDLFIDFFCRNRPPYSCTRIQSDHPQPWKDWKTPTKKVKSIPENAELTEPPKREKIPLNKSLVLQHLMGEALPGLPGRWIAPWSRKWVRVVAIDVDLRKGEIEDFRSRCNQLRHALRALGVPNNGVLEVWTPSGGKHFYFLLRHITWIDDIRETMKLVGIVHRPGKFEVYPSLTAGLRLPFGKIPGKRHNPTVWVRFIQRVRSGRFPLVDWSTCAKNAQHYWAKHSKEAGPVVVKAQVHELPATTSSAYLGKPAKGLLGPVNRVAASFKVHDQQLTTCPGHNDPDRRRYLELIEKSARTSADVDEIWRLGIRAEGTRYHATTLVVWHLLFAKHMPAEEVIKEVTRWVYETGRNTSKDVQADLKRGTRRLAIEIAQLTTWLTKRAAKCCFTAQRKDRLSKAEVEQVARWVQDASREDGLELLEFALRFLLFAKQTGEAAGNGWHAEVHAGKIMRSWPRCSGQSYKHKRAKFEALKAIEIVRGAWRTRTRSGRATTYLIKVPPSLSAGADMTIEEARDYAAQCFTKNGCIAVPTPREVTTNDTKCMVVENNQVKGTPSGSSDESELPNSVQCSHSPLPDPQRAFRSRASGAAACLDEVQQGYRDARRLSFQLPRPRRTTVQNCNDGQAISESPLNERVRLVGNLNGNCIDLLLNGLCTTGVRIQTADQLRFLLCQWPLHRASAITRQFLGFDLFQGLSQPDIETSYEQHYYAHHGFSREHHPVADPQPP